MLYATLFCLKKKSFKAHFLMRENVTRTKKEINSNVRSFPTSPFTISRLDNPWDYNCIKFVDPRIVKLRSCERACRVSGRNLYTRQKILKSGFIFERRPEEEGTLTTTQIYLKLIRHIAVNNLFASPEETCQEEEEEKTLGRRKDEYFQRQLGCQLPWLSGGSSTGKSCDSIEQTRKLVVSRE